jgi:hypothetical protein
MEGGFFTVIVVFLLTVALSIFPEFSQQFRLLTPIEESSSAGVKNRISGQDNFFGF